MTVKDWMLRKILGIHKRKTMDIYADMLETGKHNQIPNIGGIGFMDGNIAPDYFSSINNCTHDPITRTTDMRVAGPNTFMFHDTRGLLACFGARFINFRYHMQFNEDYTEADITGSVLGIHFPKFAFHGVIRKTDEEHVYNRWNPLPESSANYTLRLIENNEGPTSQRPNAQEKLDEYEYRWTGAEGVALFDLPGLFLTKVVEVIILPFKMFM